MSTKRFLLINPWITDFAAYDFWVKPVGLLCLAGLLRQAGARITLLDCLDRHDPGWLRWQGLSRARSRWDGTGKFRRERIPKPAVLADVPRYYCRYGWSLDYFRSRLTELDRPDAVLVTSHMTYWYLGVKEVVREVKLHWPDVPVVVGGIYATLCTDHAVRELGADVVLPGQLVGENLASLWDVLELTGQPPADDWLPYLDGLPYDLYPNLQTAAVITSLGCPFRCTFCASQVLQPRFRRLDPRVVAREIALLASRRGVQHFAFFDDALLIDAPRHFLPLCEELQRLGVKASFHTPNGLHVREISSDVATAMAATGFKTIWLSYETRNPERQRAMGAKVSDAELERAVANLVAVGYRRSDLGVYVLGGLPGQSVSEVVDSLLMVAMLGARSSLAIFSPIPGTEEWRKAVEAGLFPADADPLLTNDTRVPIRSAEFNPTTVQRLRHLVKWFNQFVTTGQRGEIPPQEALVEWVLTGHSSSFKAAPDPPGSVGAIEKRPDFNAAGVRSV